MLRTSALLCCSVVAGALVTAAAPALAVDAGDEIEFETLGIVADTASINLSRPQLLRISDSDEFHDVSTLLGADTSESSFADEVMEAVGEVQQGRVVLIGIIDQSCTPATVAGLERAPDGDLVMTAPGHVPEPIECFVANTTVAVMSVAAGDAPSGSTDHAELMAFEQLDPDTEPVATAVELTGDDGDVADLVPADGPVPHLPLLAKDDRRFAFVLAGCQNETAELLVTGSVPNRKPGGIRAGYGLL